jgi:hypothetical protein
MNAKLIFRKEDFIIAATSDKRFRQPEAGAGQRLAASILLPWIARKTIRLQQVVGRRLRF